MKKAHVHAIQSRITRLAARARDSVCAHTIASTVRSMTAELDPEAIPALIALLDHQHDAKGSVRHALFRYGESAEGSLRAAAKDSPQAAPILDDIAFRERLLQVGCF
jgi:hypothetical protein